MSLKDLVERLRNQNCREERCKIGQRREDAVDDIRNERESHARMKVSYPRGIDLCLTRSPQPSHLAPFARHHLRSARETESIGQLMKVKIKSWHAIAQWRWDTGNADHDEVDGEGDVCGICRVPYEGCCPTCKVPGDDCPLS